MIRDIQSVVLAGYAPMLNVTSSDELIKKIQDFSISLAEYGIGLSIMNPLDFFSRFEQNNPISKIGFIDDNVVNYVDNIYDTLSFEVMKESALQQVYSISNKFDIPIKNILFVNARITELEAIFQDINHIRIDLNGVSNLAEYLIDLFGEEIFLNPKAPIEYEEEMVIM